MSALGHERTLAVRVETGKSGQSEKRTTPCRDLQSPQTRHRKPRSAELRCGSILLIWIGCLGRAIARKRRQRRSESVAHESGFAPAPPYIKQV